MNLIITVVNGFKMPEKDLEANTILHRPIDASTRLPWLADIIPAPPGIRLSIGDIYLFAGLAIVIFFLESHLVG